MLSRKIFHHELNVSNLVNNPSVYFSGNPFKPKPDPFQFSELNSRYFQTWQDANGGKQLNPRQMSNILMSDTAAAYNHWNMTFYVAGAYLYSAGPAVAQLYDSKSGKNGHIYIRGMLLDMGYNAKELLTNGLWLPIYWSSVHPNVYMLEKDSPLAQKLGQDNLSAQDRLSITLREKVAFEQGHDAVVNKILTDKKIPLSRLSVYINGHMVDLSQIETSQRPDGRIRAKVQAVTWLGKHGLSGQATHSLEWHPAHPEKVAYMVYGTGEGHCAADKSNGPISYVLWECCGDTLIEMVKSMTEQSAFGSEARDKGYTGLLWRKFQKSPEAGFRHFITMAGFNASTPAALAMARRTIHIPYNLGALVPFSDEGYNGDLPHERGN
ncbi:hypothetical protein ASPZODRAFT_16097 [Penicilliopsis zonata CBS 506.65]|uniref:Uncharacterized protein n=1 Tax=Penicilliopsis zonata CBS 506.65 TaxID=1073090 RepID=A0A1L9SJS3_9EURO|nr:hypothetical protein ASPZODRAFT_16097 [Penicilliopsis zonata CBS 506.65]OJJ47417.1 hypothetical protein ASPZODRAFT_16097 [Penicilliopsis zonata CBS 506.65]